MKNKTTFFLTVLFVLLILGNVYFINAANKASYEILIGKPVIGENGSEAVDFQHSTPLKRKSDIDTIVFSLLRAVPAEPPQTAPDAVMWITDPSGNMVHYQWYLWIVDDAFIFSGSLEDTAVYEQASSNYYVAELQRIIESQLTPYQ